MNKNIIVKICIIIGTFAILLFLLLTNIFKLKDNKNDAVIAYMIENEPIENTNPVIYNKTLYVNNKLVNLKDFSTSIKAKQLSDILIVEQLNGGSSNLYAVDKNANVIGVFTPNSNSVFEGFNVLETKSYYRNTYRIDKDNLYVQTDNFSNSGADYMLCNVYKDDNDIVLYEEKFEYLGNNKFSNSIVTKKVTRKQYMQQHNITCNENKVNGTILYRIEKGTIENALQDKLYVDGKLVDFKSKNTSIKTRQLNDILIAEVDFYLSPRMLYAVDKNANVIGVFTPSDNDYFDNVNIIPTKLYYTGSYEGAYRIDGNNIYIQTQLGQANAYPAVCRNLDDDDIIVMYEEKFEYLGNNKFSEPVITKQISRKQYLQENNITCGEKNETDGNVLSLKISPNTIKFYINGQEKGKYQCENSVLCDVAYNPYSPSFGFHTTDAHIYDTGLISLYEDGTSNDTTKVVVFDIYNNKVIGTFDNITDSYSLGKYVIIKNKDDQTAVLNNNYEFVKQYSNKQYVYISGYVGNNNFNAEKDMIITIENKKYGIEKISKDEVIINHKYDNITLTDGITVYSTNGTQRDFYYTDTVYQNKYFKGKIGNKWYLYYLDTEQKVIEKGYDRLYLINQNTIAVYENGKISFVDYKGNDASSEKIDVYISSEHFYNSPEGIRFIYHPAGRGGRPGHAG